VLLCGFAPRAETFGKKYMRFVKSFSPPIGRASDRLPTLAISDAWLLYLVAHEF